MSGDNQHFIPQHVLRGFKSPDSPREKRIWVFRKDGEPTLDQIKEVAAQTHFYSEPSGDGSATLDDQITRYENRLAALMRLLRKQPIGPLPSGDAPAEIIAHLAQRTDSIRTSLSTGTKDMLLHLLGLTNDKNIWRGLMGLDGDTPSPTFRQTLTEAFRDDPRFKSLNLPIEALERILFGFARENFERLHAESSAMARGALSQMLWRTDSLVMSGHQKALANAIVPEPRLQALRQIKWAILASHNNLILPDCVAIAIDRKGEASPFALADLDDLAHVAMPLSPEKLLVGTSDGVGAFRDFLFPLQAAACSEKFFLSAFNDSSLLQYTRYLSVRSFALIHDAVSKAVEEIKLQKLGVSGSGSAVAKEAAQPVSDLTIDLHFQGTFSQDVANAIAECVRGIVAGVANAISLKRLDGITFADDYPAALCNLDRGFTVHAQLQTTEEPDVEGVAMAPLVLRDGVVKSHVVLRSHLGFALIYDREDWRQDAVYTLVTELAQVACTELFDTAFPNVLLQPMLNIFNAHRFVTVEGAWNTYFAARVAAQLSPSQPAIMNELLVGALKRAATRIPTARLDYRFHGRVDELLEKSLRDVRWILHHAARLVGHHDGLGEPAPCVPEGELKSALESLNLDSWLEFFAADLRRLWERAGEWTSLEEFMALNVHVERLLWQFGIVLWQSPGGQCSVTVPLATDIPKLRAEVLKRPLWLLKSVASRFVGGLRRQSLDLKNEGSLRQA